MNTLSENRKEAFSQDGSAIASPEVSKTKAGSDRVKRRDRISQSTRNPRKQAFTVGRELVAVRMRPSSVRRTRGGQLMPFDQAVAAEFCERTSAGESIRSICKLRHMPDVSVLHRWLSDPRYCAFDLAYSGARLIAGDVMDARILEVADEVLNGTVAPDAARVAIGAFQWRAARLNRKVYGDKLEVESSARVDLGALIVAARQRLAVAQDKP